MTDSAAFRANRESRRIQTLRGLACFLLVGFHVAARIPPRGCRSTTTRSTGSSRTWFLHVRMPLFTFLRASWYAYRPVRDAGSCAPFASPQNRTSARTAGRCYNALLSDCACGSRRCHRQASSAEAWRVYLYPYAHLLVPAGDRGGGGGLIFAVVSVARPVAVDGDANAIRHRDVHRVRDSCGAVRGARSAVVLQLAEGAVPGAVLPALAWR